jgi:carbamoyltransferase
LSPQERLSRRKHDSGGVGGVVEHALDCLGLGLEDIRLVVANNHHFRIGPFEDRLPWGVALGRWPEEYLDEGNLLGQVPVERRHELSHHLAHVWSAVAQAPFDEGLVVVMDGMGELHEVMASAYRYATAVTPDP